MKCPKCNAEITDGAKFCPECGAETGLSCPQCHKPLKAGTKFCPECGYCLEAAAQAAPAGRGLSMGDKNVVAGDVVTGDLNRSQYYGNVSHNTTNTTNTTNNTTNVINQDETKKVVTCHICGRNLTIAQAISCPGCGQVTCGDCYDDAARLCKKCVAARKGEKEEVYRQALFHALEDGLIAPRERGELLQLKNQLGLSDERAAELETLCRADRASGKGNAEEPLTMFEKITLDKVKGLLWDAGSEQEAWELINRVYQQHKFDEEVISLRVQCAQAVLPTEQFRALLREIQADIPVVYLASIDLALQEGSLSDAESLLATTGNIWPDNYLLTCRKALNFLAMADTLNEDFFKQQALALMMEAPEPTDKFERSWKVKTLNSISCAMGDQPEPVTPESCRKQDLYYKVASSVFVSKKRKAEMAAEQQRTEEEARKTAEAEAAARRRAEEEARKKAEEEEKARRKAEMEAKAKSLAGAAFRAMATLSEEASMAKAAFQAMTGKKTEEPAKPQPAEETRSQAAESAGSGGPFEAFEQALRKVHDEKVFIYGQFVSKKLRNAIAEYAPRVSESDVLVQVDDTVFGSAKDGCLITTNHIYVKDVNGTRDAQISAGTRWSITKGILFKSIDMDGQPVFSYTQPSTASMEQLVAALKLLVKCLG